MLTRFIVDSLHACIEFAIWVLLIACLIAGYNYSEWGGVMAMFLVWLVFSVFIGGPILLFLDIRERVKNIEQMKSEQESGQVT